MKDCPCGLNSPYTDCCGRLIRGGGYADTAEDLMRARYSAFVKKEWKFLHDTLCAEERAGTTPRDLEKGSSGLEWNKLEIHGTRGGGPADDEGEVEFVAHYTEDGADKSLHERSAFFKERGRWVYSENKSSNHVHAAGEDCGHEAPPQKKPVVRDQPKVGRNDPCPCASGKKYKKCCGR